MVRLAQQVTLFTLIDTSPHLHLNCNTETCVQLGGDICITRDLSEYLKTQTRIQQAHPARRGNDWQHLISKDSEILNDLSSPEFYRLRFKKHAEIGKQYVKDTLLKHPNVWENQDLSSFWGSPLKTIYNDTRLDVLFLRAETQSVGTIYRLYDILDGISPNTKRFKIIDFLALHFALGHGKEMPHCAESIAELLAGFQFFKTFALKKQAFYRFEFTKKQEKKPKLEVETETNKKLTAYLLSQEGINEAKKIWIQYRQAYKLYLSNTTLSIGAKDDDDFVRQLRFALSFKSIRPEGSPSSLGFAMDIEGLYHAYKHENDTRDFHDIEKLSPNESMFNYLEMIRCIILQGTLSKTHPPRPDQFEEARIYTFELTTPRGILCQVFVKHSKGHKTFTLSCYSRNS